MSTKPPSRKSGLPDVVGVLEGGRAGGGGTGADDLTLADVEKG